MLGKDQCRRQGILSQHSVTAFCTQQCQTPTAQTHTTSSLPPCSTHASPTLPPSHVAATLSRPFYAQCMKHGPELYMRYRLEDLTWGLLCWGRRAGCPTYTSPNILCPPRYSMSPPKNPTYYPKYPTSSQNILWAPQISYVAPPNIQIPPGAPGNDRILNLKIA